MSELTLDLKDNVEYLQLLRLMGQLSNIFSDSKIPYIHYRVTENLFCKCFNAENLSRSDIAFDARYNKNLGVGIKTFQLNSNKSLEKIAEFNKFSNELSSLKGEDLARRVSDLRNIRIDFANNLYNLSDNIYHIIGRREGELVLFNSSYSEINVDKIRNVKVKGNTSVYFDDGSDEYVYNYSKSVLYKQFYIPDDNLSIGVDIIDDPYELLKKLLADNVDKFDFVKTNKNIDYVILPLFSERGGINIPEKSGVNQWNASGRKRGDDEVYVSIPAKIQHSFPDFFPDKDTYFELLLPNGEVINAKVSQGKIGKALMSNPNKALGHWLLRDVIRASKRELVTMDTFNKLGFNSLMVTKIGKLKYSITVSDVSYTDFI